LFGRRVHSAFVLPEWLPWTGDPEHPFDVIIASGVVPPFGPKARRIGPAIELLDDALRMSIPDVAHYRLDGTSQITIEPMMQTDAADIRLFLYSTILSALCYRLGLIPLHVGAVEVDGRALIFGGRSGIGKSTLTAHLVARGYRLVADDMCALDIRSGQPLIWPSFPRVKLWQDAADHLGWPTTGLVQARAELRKFFVPIDHYVTKPLSPAHLVILTRAALPSETSETTLTGIDALSAHEAVHRPRLGRELGAQGQIFLGLAALAKSVAITKLTRLDDPALLPALADRVIDLARGNGS
jgi:hypothetical protein